jgi:hypothetical protein
VDDEELFLQLADRLRDAHRRVAALEVDAAEKSSITRQLLVISDASKHSVMRASQRLDTFLADLEQRHPTPSG